MANAYIKEVIECSPADDAGFTPGCAITSVDGVPLRDVIDWRWLTSDDIIRLGYIDTDGDIGEVELEREPGQDWGIVFRDLIFDDIKLCRNACTFCFMRQLPPDARPSLTLRDDDFRLSFLTGTFATLTNLSPDDEVRILEQRLSPLRVSFHATDAAVRKRLIGKHAPHGLAALERLLEAGIQVHAQIVLVPGVNDGEVLRDTLEWAYARPNILTVGIVPLGFTKHQQTFDVSFNDELAAQAVLECIAPFQQRAQAQRDEVWVYAADEFYRNAYKAEVRTHIPGADTYGNFDMFEDGIGIIRSSLDDFEYARSQGIVDAAVVALDKAQTHAYYIAGEAMQPYFNQLLEESALGLHMSALTVKNDYFGGNVDVTGLLTGVDVIAAIRDVLHCNTNNDDAIFFLPRVMFNDDAVTLDGQTCEDIEKATGARVVVVSCNPAEYLVEIADFVRADKVQ